MNGYSTGDFSVNGISGAFASDVQHDIKMADLNPISSGFEILTDVAGNKQEFLVLTPEPSTLLLLVAGLFALVLLSRSKMARLTRWVN